MYIYQVTITPEIDEPYIEVLKYNSPKTDKEIILDLICNADGLFNPDDHNIDIKMIYSLTEVKAPVVSISSRIAALINKKSDETNE